VLTWGEPEIKAAIDRWTHGVMPSWLPQAPTGLNGIMVPGLHNAITRIPPVTAAPAPYAAVFTLNWLSASGTACFLATLVTALLLGVKPRQVVGIYRATFAQLSFAMLTIASMLGLAYLMNYSGMTSTLLQRRRRMAGCIPHGQRHVGQRALRQPAGGDGQCAGPEPRADRLGELGRRRDGQDDFRAEHRRGRRCDGYDRRR
jgi:hypothetical protein